MQAITAPVPSSKLTRWSGRVLSGLAILFLIFDGITKVINIQPVIDASTQLGLPVGLAPSIGILLLVCLIVYGIPQSSVLGAILLTGYLGGAIAIQLRSGAALFPIVFPVIIGALIWGGLFLRDQSLRALVPLRR
ncbi:DoxX family protein [soil metagenome]